MNNGYLIVTVRKGLGHGKSELFGAHFFVDSVLLWVKVILVYSPFPPKHTDGQIDFGRVEYYISDYSVDKSKESKRH